MDYSIFKCPLTSEKLHLADLAALTGISVPKDILRIGSFEKLLVNDSKTYLYPVVRNILILLPQYAIYIGNENSTHEDLAFDKKRVFDYYNQLDHIVSDSFKGYADLDKWVDQREVASEYFHITHARAAKFYKPSGKYFLDIASGPVSVQEYADLSNGYEFHICADISINALLLAQHNLSNCNKKGIFICADITNIPLQDNICDTVISQHTLYHVPKNEQAKAVEELYRVARPGAKIVIVYSWFYRSVLMNISLLPVQLYRIARHLAGKIYVRLFKSKPRLYFYAHSYKWFKTKFSFSDQIEIYSWSSVNKYFLNIYIHSKLGGKRLLKWMAKAEEKHSPLMGRIGEYPVIVITKK